MKRLWKKIIDDIKISFDLKISEKAKIQQVCEKNIFNVENQNRAAENIKETSDKICIELENHKSKNMKMSDEIKNMAENNKKK